jgi:hypothetical protein
MYKFASACKKKILMTSAKPKLQIHDPTGDSFLYLELVCKKISFYVLPLYIYIYIYIYMDMGKNTIKEPPK